MSTESWKQRRAIGALTLKIFRHGELESGQLKTKDVQFGCLRLRHIFDAAHKAAQICKKTGNPV